MNTLEAEPMTETRIAHGPLLEEGYLTAGLDYYKMTMSQFIHEREPDAEVTFTFKNRGEQRLLDYVEPEQLTARFEAIRERGFHPNELQYLGTILKADGTRMFGESYIEHIANSPMPKVDIQIMGEEVVIGFPQEDVAIATTGEWSVATFWETVVMSEVNEAYFENFVAKNGLDVFELYEEGDRRLSEKIAFLREHPEIKVAEFGTRRRFSLRWQKHVIERMQNECPDNLVGTSNVAFANTMSLKPVGTFAHELPMGYAGLADARDQDIRASHGNMLDDWYDFYGDELAIALSDTFGSDFFFSDFTPERTAKYRGTRHDSGDPIEYGEKAIAHYQKLDVDTATKTILYSDGLNVQKAANVTEIIGGRINAPFGIGTDLTNDLGLTALNIVMKLTHVTDAETGNQADTVKLSDNPGKHTGPAEQVARYQKIFEV